MDWNNIIYLSIGFVFGIVADLLIEQIKLFFKKRALLNGAIIELSELRIKLASACFYIGKETGNFDRGFLKWCEPIFRDYKGPEPTEIILTGLENLLKLNDSQIEEYRLGIKSPKGIGIGLKRYEIPFIQSKMNEISILKNIYQNIIFNIMSKLEPLNAEVDFAMKYHFMTYDSSISPENHDRIEKDIMRRAETIQQMAMTLVDRISELIDLSDC